MAAGLPEGCGDAEAKVVVNMWAARTWLILAQNLPVVPQKAVAEVSKIGNL